MEWIHKTTLIILLIAVIFVFGCGRSQTKAEEINVKNISIAEAALLWEKKEAVIVDVRTPEEYQQGHIPGVMLIPLDQLQNRMNEIPTVGKVLVICRSGNRSSQAVRMLQEKGYNNLYNVSGGMLEWKGLIEASPL